MNSLVRGARVRINPVGYRWLHTLFMLPEHRVVGPGVGAPLGTWHSWTP